MIGKIFGILTVLSFAVSIIQGTVGEVGVAVVEGAQNAVALTISLMGVICLWNGVMRVLQAAGLTDKLAKLISPLLRILYPDTYKRKKNGDKAAAQALEAVSANFSANIIGVGNAATPFAINAMKYLHDGTNEATDDMIMFTVFNCASVQLIPTTLIALRTAADSTDIFGVILPIWICSAATSIFAVIIVKLFSAGKKFYPRKHKKFYGELSRPDKDGGRI